MECSYLEVIALSDVVFTDGVPVAIEGKSFIGISSVHRIVFKQEGKRRNGNFFYEQTLKATVNDATTNNVLSFGDEHLIVKVHRFNTNVVVWGSEDNPVQVNMSFLDDMVELSFFRDSVFPL